MQVTLVVLEGDAGERELTVDLPVVLGRSRAAGLRLQHPTVSRRHCEVFEAGGLAVVRDLGSLNGTLVEGQRIEQSPVKPGQRLSVGPVTFRVDYQYEGEQTLSSAPDSPTTAPTVPVPAEQTDSPDPVEDTPQAPIGLDSKPAAAGPAEGVAAQEQTSPVAKPPGPATRPPPPANRPPAPGTKPPAPAERRPQAAPNGLQFPDPEAGGQEQPPTPDVDDEQLKDFLRRRL